MFIIIALLPLFIAILLLLIFQWNVCDTGWTTLGVTIALVSLVPIFHRTPLQIVLSLGEGSATMLTAGVILLPALFFYQMQWETGAIDVLMRGLARFVPDRNLHTLLLVLGVGPCIEALCGSGSGAVAILPLLVHLHNNKFKAIQLSLLSQIIVPWGSLSLGTMLAANLTGLPVGMLSIHTALLLFPSTIGFSILALLLSGGRRALERYWCVALLAGGLLMLVTCLCSQFFITEVSGVLAGSCVIVLLLVWGLLIGTRTSHHYEYVNTFEATPFMLALLPYILLTTGIFVSRLFPLVTVWLQTHGVLVYPDIKLHLALLYSPGLWLLLAALVHIPLFSLQRVHLFRIHVKTWQRFLPAIVAMVNFLSIAALMQDSGMIDTLGGAAMMLGENYVWVASLIGAAGGWLTNTILGGNALTVHMQMDIGTYVGLPLPWLIAAQNASAAMASAISPSRIILLTTSAGLFGKETLVLRKIGLIVLWSIVLTTLLLVWFTSSLWLGGIIVLLALLVVVNAPIFVVVAGYFGKCLGESNRTLISVTSSPFDMKTKHFHHPIVCWTLKILPYGGLLLVNVLYASYSLVSLGPLNHIDPVLFVCFQTLLLAPIGFVLLLRARRQLNRDSIYRGLQLGGFLSAELLCFTHSLKDTGMTEAMVFSTVNGIVATFIAWKIFGQRISTQTRWACMFALGGAILVWYTSPTRWQGDFTAFVSGMCLTGYSFHIEQLLVESQQHRLRVLPIMGIQFLMMALTTLVIALCFGQWQTIHFWVPSDLVALVYLSLATILLPCFIMLIAQRSISATTVAFFSVIEPLAGVGFAFFSVGERLPTLAYIGGGIAIVGIVLQVIAGTTKNMLAPASSDFAVHP